MNLNTIKGSVSLEMGLLYSPPVYIFTYSTYTHSGLKSVGMIQGGESDGRPAIQTVSCDSDLWKYLKKRRERQIEKERGRERGQKSSKGIVSAGSCEQKHLLSKYLMPFAVSLQSPNYSVTPPLPF